MELPAPHGDVEARARARHRQQRRPQAGRAVAARPRSASPSLAAEAGLPRACSTSLPGFGETAGQALGAPHGRRHARLHRLDRGRQAVPALRRRVEHEARALECGGKSPNIVFADCADLDAAATAAAWGIFFNQGEVCNAGSRLLVHDRSRTSSSRSSSRGREDAAAGRPARPHRRGWARIVDETQLDRVLGYIDAGKQEGAELGSAAAARARNRRLLRRADDLRRRPQRHADRAGGDLRARARDHPLQRRGRGDARSPTTRSTGSPPRSGRATSTRPTGCRARSAPGRSGSTPSTRATSPRPFGGFKQSGFGRDKSLHALEKYTELKTIWIQLR